MVKVSIENTIADITFVGSGIAMGYTLLKFLDKLHLANSTDVLKINIIEKYSEFFYGIPYGKRYGKSVLLINSLRSFLPEEERTIFINWLKVNKNRLIKGYLMVGEEQAKRWLDNNINDINADVWDDLFIPKSFFGEFIHSKVNESIRLAEENGLIKTAYIVSEVVDLDKDAGITEVTLNTGDSVYSKKIVLCIGSLPTKKIYSETGEFEDNDFLLINDIYNEDLGSNFDKIESFLVNRKNKETNVFIIGANASSLETIYKLNNKKEVNSAITNYIILSTHGKIPDSEINESLKETFIPEHLISLQNKKEITAEDIANAAFKDIDLSDKINLGAALTVDIISNAIGILLNTLSKKQLEIFAYKYRNEIGRRQRCAGIHYSSIVDRLRDSNKFIHIAGRYSGLIKVNDSDYKFEYIDSKTQKKQTFPKNIHLVVNCIGGIDLENENVPVLIKNILAKKYAIANKSKIGFKVNEAFETSKNLYIAGPLLAGNVIKGKPLWHLEHCTRIIWSSNLLGESLFEKKPKSPLEIIKNKDDWNAFLSSIDNYDVYHTYDYHQICKNESDSAILIKYEHNGVLIGLPLLIRKIHGSSYLDAISAYGYSGPVRKDISENFDLNHYKKHLNLFFVKEKIVSVFIRLNPYLPYQNIIFHNYGELSYLGKVVNINLTLNLEQQRHKYHRRLKNHVNKANRDCAVKKVVTKEDFQVFKNLYFENMDRVNAKDFYYFSEDYFQGLNNSKDFETETLLAIHNETGKPIAGCMFIKTNKTVQYHLSGASIDYLHLNAVKLLIDNMRLKATEQGYENFNLGGGIGASSDDSLFRFKSSFSDEFNHFFVWKLIVNLSKYKQLCKKNNVSGYKVPFFPLYRYNE